jgi:hypothetical protein
LLSRDERHLVLRAAPSLAARALPTQVGVVDLHPPLEQAIVFANAHDLHELVLHEPGGLVENAQVAHRLECGDVVLGLGQQRCMARNQRDSPSLVASKIVPLMTLH